MARVPTPKERDEARIDELVGLGANKLDIWRYYSDRADKFAEQLWTTGTWLFGIITAVLALPFAAKFIQIDSQRLIRVESRPLTILVYLFGLCLCGYSYSALRDMREHIERNWERSDLARTGQWRKAHWCGRKLHGWLLLMVFGIGSAIAFASLIVMAVFW
jgi:hypothetical protein